MIVLGPEIFADQAGDVICWKDVNFIQQAKYHRLCDAVREHLRLPKAETIARLKQLTRED